MINIGKLFEQLVEEESYICVTNLIGPKVLQFLVGKEIEDFENFLSVANRLYVNLPAPGKERNREDLLKLDPENVSEKIKEHWRSISETLNYEIVENADQEFPLLIDIFQTQGVIFAFQVKEKQESLEKALDYMVEIEDYKTAAEIKSVLQEMNSKKVKQ